MENTFTFDSAEKEYRMEQRCVEIRIEEELMTQETAAYAVEILTTYSERLDIIWSVLSDDEGFIAFFGKVNKDEMPKKLHEPSIRILDMNAGIISYCNHEYDDTHIIDVEFSGVLKDFSNVSIDG